MPLGFPAKACRLLVCLVVITATLAAQPGPGPFEAVVGVPYNIDPLGFGDLGDALTAISDGAEVSFSITLGGGALPPGLALKSNGLVVGTPTAAGQFNFSIRFLLKIRIAGLPPGFSIPDIDLSFPCTIVVKGGNGPKVSAEPGGLSFVFTTGAAAASQSIAVSNQDALPRDFTAAGSMVSGVDWVSISGGGTVAPFQPAAVVVTVNPAKLPAGTYVGSVAIAFTGGTERFDIPVVVSVTSAQQILSLSQTGLTFRATAGGGAPPAQSFTVLNGGGGALDWTATSSTLSGGASWLAPAPAAGKSDAASAPAVQVQVRPAGLAPGDYYGQVRVEAQGVANSPQSVSVVLTVVGAAANLPPSVLPTGLIFVGQAGAANPAPQNVEITNLSSRPLTFSTLPPTFEQGSNWFAAQTKTGTVTTGQPSRIPVQVTLTGLAAGVYRGELDIKFVESNTVRRIDVLLIVTPRATPALKTDSLTPRLADACTPTKLIPVFTQLGSSFTTTAAWPTALEVRVVSDCGQPLINGSVVMSFSSGDPLLAMTSLRDGRWTGTWQARSVSAAPVTITTKAQQASPVLSGTASIGGSLQPNPTAPVISAGGAVSAASFAPLAPLAPGGLIRISGTNLAGDSTEATDLPLGTELAGTQVLLAGLPLPLRLVANGQINAIVPFGVPVNATQQMIVRRATSYSVPEAVTIAPAQPAVFTKDLSGKGPALAAAVKPDGTEFLVDGDNPVTEGDTLVLSCAGLGPVDPAVAAGAAGPSDPVSQTTNPVTVTIGGVQATVASSVLAAGMVGIYRVTVTVPAGITPAPDAPVVLTVAGQVSPVVTIAVAQAKAATESE